MSGTRLPADRLQEALVRLSRISRKREAAVQEGSPSARPAPASAPAPDAPMPARAAWNGAGPSMSVAAQSADDSIGEVLDRLERIEERLGDIQRPARVIPASRDLFGEWVRLRAWEEIAWGDFLKLRRAGRI